MKKYGWVAAGIVLVIAGVMMKTCSDRPVDDSAVAPITEEQRPSPIDRELPRPALTIVKEAETVRTRTAEDPTPSTESYASTPGTNWAVVAAIYRDYDAAARRAASFEDVGGIRPSVFPAKGKGTKYMVVVGQGLTRARAEALRTRAVAAGLPPDMYVTLLSE
jgi:SPOR domain